MSSNDLHERVMDLFDRLCDTPTGDRESLLNEACATDAELRRHVEALLRADLSKDQLFDDGISNERLQSLVADLANEPIDSPALPNQIAGYRIVRQVGEGGMGIIYEAQQESPQRRVALKVLRPGFINRDMLKRFQHEAHVLGQLQHQGIAQIYEAGVADLPLGRQPFFVMEFIEGEPLNRHADQHELDTHHRLELMARICDAVQHAHQRGVIHRDLKPSNILIVNQELGTSSGTGFAGSSATKVDSIGQPKVLDFGIARVTEADLQTVTVQTEVGQLVGTLAYMSPEQLEGNSSDLDTRCDVYALGVILYQLIAGKRPHDLTGKSVTEAARMIREDEPTALGTIDKSCRGDIETMVSKAIEKDRGRRYASAAEFAADIRRHIAHQPIEARPPSTFYQLSKFARRNRGLVAGLVLTFVALVVGLIGTAYGLHQANQQRDHAVAAKRKTDQANLQLESVVDYQSAMLRNVDIAEMGQRIMSDIKTEAKASLSESGDQANAQLATFEQVLSRVNATTIANRAIDASILSEAVDALDSVFADQPLLRADLRSSMAEVYENIGLAQKSLTQVRIEWETRREALGAEHPDTLLAKQNIAAMLHKTGEFEEAERTARELLQDQRRVQGERHIDALNTQEILGMSLIELTRFEEGAEYLIKALSDLEQTVGSAHHVTLSTRRQLGEFYVKQRYFEKAREAFETVLQEYETQLGPDHAHTLSALGSLSRVYFLQNDYNNALTYSKRICATLAESKGTDHPDTLTARQNLANTLTELRRFEEAEPVVTDTLDQMRRVMGTDHPSTVNALGGALRLAVRMERWTEAEAYGKEAHAIALRTLGPDNIRTLNASNNLAAVYLKSESHDAGRRQAENTLRDYQRVLGTDHYRTLGMQQTLAKILMSAGRLEEAESVLQDALSRFRTHHPKSSGLAGTLGHGVSTLIGLDRGAEAEVMARELLEWCKKRSVGVATLGRCHLWIARTVIAQQNYAEAEASLTVAVGQLSENTPDTDWTVALARLLQQIVAFHTGKTDHTDEVIKAYERLIASKNGMRPEERNTILPEVQQIIQSLQSSMSESAE